MIKRPSPFNGLRHLALKVYEFDECLNFYTEVMGMQVLRKASDNLVYLTCGNDNLSLGRAHSPTEARAQTLDHFGFVVDSKQQLQEWFEYMQSINVPLLDRPHDHSDGARSFHCQDPAGNIIQPLFHPAVSGQSIR
ncbi:VOC family protein [Vibrio profundi]|uniref:VOC family protein n=1 Tax=Vibrio profundi TaxID=1774960 RepID=UPI0037364FF2